MWGMAYYQVPDKPPEVNHEIQEFSNMPEKELLDKRGWFIFGEKSVFQPVQRNEIVGIDHILTEIDLYVRLIQNFGELESKNAELDTGVIFVGAPGSGKTYCARYLATEAKARFIDVSKFPRRKSLFTAEDIAYLFSLLKQYVTEKNEPIIVFWDEFETFTDVEKNEDKKIALAGFKTELSGIQGKLRGVFIVVATNKPSLIPDDVVRPGRLGKIIRFTELTRHAKKILLEHFVNQYEHDQDIDFESLSFLISADYPPDIEETVKDAWRYNVMAALGTDKKPCLTKKGLIKVLIKQARGTPNGATLSNRDMNAIGIYEIGRAIITRTLKYNSQLIVLERVGFSDAYRIAENEQYSVNIPLNKICDHIAIKYGGIIAQELCGIEPNTKQIHDFNSATADAHNFVEQLRSGRLSTEFSISSLVQSRSSQEIPTSVGVADNDLYNTKRAIETLLGEQQDRVKSILNHYGKEFLEKAVQKLIEKNYMLQVDIDNLLDKDYIPPPTPVEKTKIKVGFTS